MPLEQRLDCFAIAGARSFQQVVIRRAFGHAAFLHSIPELAMPVPPGGSDRPSAARGARGRTRKASHDARRSR
jgi:hypothetical protein